MSYILASKFPKIAHTDKKLESHINELSFKVNNELSAIELFLRKNTSVSNNYTSGRSTVSFGSGEQSRTKANTVTITASGTQTIAFQQPRTDGNYIPLIWFINTSGYMSNAVVIPSTISNGGFNVDVTEAGTLYWAIIDKE